ncbi:hypothetical protein [Aromatoleum toluclasticum]|uniref:hypothetical protein n=1 Tax=Aromatoleum toluclasticum TaxID=92003 RepID=UPI0003611369|nr:hypothetical protein [Aromatoleum toluclasticum]
MTATHRKLPRPVPNFDDYELIIEPPGGWNAKLRENSDDWLLQLAWMLDDDPERLAMPVNSFWLLTGLTKSDFDQALELSPVFDLEGGYVWRAPYPSHAIRGRHPESIFG